MKIEIDQLNRNLLKIYDGYTDEILDAMEESMKTQARKGANMLKKSSPKRSTSNKAYAKGWRAKKVGSAWVIHNVNKYQITHLLEKPHAKIGGGRTRPSVHIAPVEKKIVRDFLRDVEKAVY